MDFSVQFGATGSAVSQLQAIHTQLNTIVETLRAQISAGSAEFEGATAANFAHAQALYDQAHAAVAADVARSSQALATIEGTYGDNEQRYATAWS